MELTRLQAEQLKNICEAYPVFSGNLMCKATKADLLDMGLIYAKQGHGISNTSDGERIGGYCPTELGLQVYQGLAFKVNE